MASMLMVYSKYPQAKSKHLGKDFRTDEVEKFKAENTKVVGLLVELVDKTPFDNFESDIILQVNNSRLNEIYDLIQNKPQVTRQYVEEAEEPVENSLNQWHNKVDQYFQRVKNIKKR